jgi:hypothetical protein
MSKRRGIFIPLLGEHLEALIDLADREWRRPVDQAAKILIEGLQRERALSKSAEDPLKSKEPTP